MYINKATIYGNLTRDPELKALPSGNKVVEFGVATNRSWKDKDNVKQEDVTFHNVVAYGKVAEIMAQYLKKGQGVYLEGRIDNRSWDDKETGKKAYRSEIVVEDFQFGPNNGANEEKRGISEEKTVDMSKETTRAPKTYVAPAAVEYPKEKINPEDIPF